jgi:hypothetical protein
MRLFLEEEPFPFLVVTTLFANGRLYTRAQGFSDGSLLVRGDRIEAVIDRADGEDERALSRRAESTVDLAGAYVLPGFVDTHIHLATLALKTARCDLAGALSARQVCDLLAAWRRERQGPSVMGVDWDESRWSEPEALTKAMLDRIDSQRPVLARRICGHVGVANTVLFAKLPPNPTLIDAESGLIREHALWEAGRLCAPDLSVLRDGLEGAIRSLHALGITAVHDIVEPKKFDAYVEGLARSGAPLRIDALMHVHPRELEPYRERARDMDPKFFRIAGVKCFLDGSLGGFTAALHEPYAESDQRGTLLMETPALQTIVEGAHARGYACAMHAIGDRAIDQALDAVEGLPRNAQGVRIEHCEVAGPAQLERLRKSPVFLALQPNFVRGWGMPGGLYEQRLGKNRLRFCNPFRTFQEAGIRFVFGSDGMPPGPLHGMRGAVEHANPNERLGRAEAIAYYTDAPNRAGLHQRDAGTLEAGQLADFVAIDANPLESPLDAIQVLKTVVGGRVVYSKGDPAKVEGHPV